MKKSSIFRGVFNLPPGSLKKLCLICHWNNLTIIKNNFMVFFFEANGDRDKKIACFLRISIPGREKSAYRMTRRADITMSSDPPLPFSLDLPRHKFSRLAKCFLYVVYD